MHQSCRYLAPDELRGASAVAVRGGRRSPRCCLPARSRQPSAAAMSPAGDGDLSPRLAELAKPALRSRRRAPSRRRGSSLAASGPGSLLRDGNRVLVEVRFEGGAPRRARSPARGRRRDRPRQPPLPDGRPSRSRPADLPRRRRGAPGSPRVTEVLAPLVRGADCGGAVASPRATRQLERRQRPRQLRRRRQRRHRRHPLRLLRPRRRARGDPRRRRRRQRRPARARAAPAARPTRSASSTTPTADGERRGPGDGPDRPRPRPGRRARLRHRLQRRTRLRRQHRTAPGRPPAPR